MLQRLLSRGVVKVHQQGLPHFGSAVSVATSGVAVEKASASLRPTPSHPKYDLLKEEFIAEYGASAALYRHKKSGAELLSLQSDDDNKVFGMVFRTPPEDDTGVPHILEHSVLCGSRKFPLKEPFVDLIKGSLQTFLNAFTYPDRTCYPVASQNLKDFYNLIHVYVDAVLFPRAVNDPLVMEQEGWHYELESPEDPLTYKGVVFNEMKGVYSSPDSLHSRACQQALFPDNTYGVDSGGDPMAIPNLTFEYFKKFHQRFYHPGNSRIYFYGDDPVDKRLDMMCEYLDEFDAADADTTGSAIQWQKKRDAPWRIQESFPTGEGEEGGPGKHMLSVNWLLNDEPLSHYNKLALEILDELLTGNSAADLRKALTDSGLGASVIGGGLSDELLQATFSTGLKGVAADKVDEVEKLILTTLEQIAERGFDKTAVDASINSLEFSMREFNTGSFPRGLSLMLGFMPSWLYGQDPVSGVRFEEPLRQIKEDLAAGKKVFEGLLKDMLVNNKHRVTVEMRPDSALEKKQEESEQSKLAKIKASMTEEDIKDIMEATTKLKAAQAAEDSPEARATLPSLTIADLDRKNKEIPMEVGEFEGVPIITHEVTSSGILYADVGMDVTCIPLEEYPLLGLLSRMLLETGTSTMDRVQLTRHISTQTGGLSMGSISGQTVNNGAVAQPDDMVAYLFLRGKAVSAKSPELFDIMRMVLTDAKLDSQQRVVEMLKETRARLEASVVGSGHSFAATRIEARYTLESYVGELTGGVSYLKTVKENLEMAERDWPAMLARLESMRSTLLAKGNFIVNLTGDKAVLEAAAPAVEDFLRSAPSSGNVVKANWSQSAKLLVPKNEGFAVPTQVNYVGKGGRLYQPGEHVPGSANVVSRFIRNGYLWDNVRVMGGAYGGFCKFSPVSGIFSFLSYRDPNLDKTLKIYDGAADFVSNFELTKEDLEMGIIGTIGDLDSPMSADQKGFTSLRRHLLGSTPEHRQRVRDEILATSRADFKAFGERLAALNKDSKSATIGSKAAFDAANAALPESDRIEVHTDIL
jgi:Zn-dependent M16 (insulinase) family peptidase